MLGPAAVGGAFALAGVWLRNRGRDRRRQLEHEERMAARYSRHDGNGNGSVDANRR